MSKKYLLGVDGGTEGLRAGIFDVFGTPLAYASTSYQTQFPAPSWAEQDPNDWWDALGKSVRKAISDSGISVDQIAAMAVDTTCCSVVALDDSGNPVRPALIWMDVRSAEQAEQMVATGDDALLINSNGSGPVSAEWMIPKALWIKQNEPENFDRAVTICEYQDYINLHLTGRLGASINNVSTRWHCDYSREGVPKLLLEKLDLGELAEKWPQDVFRLGELVGRLTPRAAGHLGLTPDLPVVQGGADAQIGMIGLGVVKPGNLALITGSSHLHLGLSEKPFHGTGIWGTYADALLPGLHTVEGGQTSTGSVINWLKNLFGESDYEALNLDASKLPPGSENLIVQEHFQGNRTPHTDPNSRGAFHGLTLKHGREHLFRAAIEGVAFGSELILESMRTNGFFPEIIVVSGGATRSELWLQIHSDVSNLPLILTKNPDAPLLGCAILAAVGAEIYEDIPTAVEQMVQFDRVIEPNSEVNAEYQPFYEAYKASYVGLRNIRNNLEN
ncbi:MAG: FGGY-family carbohydrate kinase [SAR324 cluster bacterium]|nr:FGGY-family carbohydrate kinase [SAR324 cluster bacterium]MDP7061035.1 FGGY-family carbohydrate kinase [Candidatus Neomarinimicrobiota bacterium]